MNKEIIISIVIVIAVLIIDIFSTNYTKQSVEDIEKSFEEIKYKLEGKEANQEVIKKQMDAIRTKWRGKYEKLAFYIEHDELEKVETEIYGINANIDTGEYDEAIEKIEKCKFILNHIEDKGKLSLKNVF